VITPNTKSPAEEKELVCLVRAAQTGQREAFDALFRRYHRAVFLALVRQIGDEAEAQEVCQEVFIRAMRKIGQLDNPLCFGGWLRSIARRMAINRAVRRGPVTPTDTDRLANTCASTETPLGAMLARERSDQLHAGLKRLTELDRRTLEAFYFHGQSLVEMSTHFRSPIGTIKRRLHMARRRLAEELGALASA